MLRFLNSHARYPLTQMDESYYSYPQRTAVVFGSSKKSWSYRDVISHAKAFANGLADRNFIQNDVILVRLPHENLQQNLIARIAVASLKGRVVTSKTSTVSELSKQLQASKARVLLYSSYDKIEDTSLADALYRLVPQMVHAPINSEISPRNFMFLRCLIQTDNYKYKGTFNYHRMMKFLSENDLNFGFECEENLIRLDKISDDVRPIVITNPSQELAFRAGVLNCLANGTPLFCINPKQSKFVSEQFNHRIDVVCTEPMEELHSQNRVLVGRGSKLYEQHPYRIQLAV